MDFYLLEEKRESFGGIKNISFDIIFDNSCVHEQWKSKGLVLILVVGVLGCFSLIWLFTTLWTLAHQAPLSKGFSRQEYWSGLPCPPPGDLPNPGTEPRSLMTPALADRFFTTSTTWEAQFW